jgi:hypothetical protein
MQLIGKRLLAADDRSRLMLWDSSLLGFSIFMMYNASSATVAALFDCMLIE